MKKFLKVFSLIVSIAAIPVALIFKYPEKSRELSKKAGSKGKKYGKKVYSKFKSKCCKDQCDC